MYPRLLPSLNLSKIIGGVSKTLQIANQVIPLYQKTKPIIKNAKSTLNILKEFKNTPNKSNTPIKKEEPVTLNNSSNSPTFFL